MNLETTYLGFHLNHPLVPGASPLTDRLEGAKQLEEAGAPMLILRSLFAEQILREDPMDLQRVIQNGLNGINPLHFWPDQKDFAFGPEEYLNHIGRVRQAISPNVPVLASLNVTRPGPWLDYLALIREAGADGLELNIYGLAAQIDRTSQRIERQVVESVELARRSFNGPMAVKLLPFYTALPNLAQQLVLAGANGIVLFNRFYQPDINVGQQTDELALRLSDPQELLLRLRWTALLAGRVQADLAVSGGVHSGADALKAILCGASAVQVVSVLMEKGPRHLTRLLEELVNCMAQHHYESLEGLMGNMSLAYSADPEAFERSYYARILQGAGNDKPGIHPENFRRIP